MRFPGFPNWVRTAVCALSSAAPLLAQFPAAQPFDDQKGRYMSFETAPLAPLVLSADGRWLYALNTAGSRLSIFDTQRWELARDLPLGLGAASIAARPGSDELWIADRIGACVTVVDPQRGAIVRTVRVGAEPYGLVFSANGDRAFVSCAGDERVDVLRTLDYTVVASIRIPGESPRGLAAIDAVTYVVPFLSGNGSAPRGQPTDVDDVVAVERPAGPGLAALPDEDLFAIRHGAQPGLETLLPGPWTGLGTVLLNLHRRPGTRELWIPNTEALNAEVRGERNFVDGQVVRNRITIVDVAGHTPPQIVDLDALAPPGVRCAQPTGLAFDPRRPWVYVSGYGTDNVAVLEIRRPGELVWLGTLELPPRLDYPRGTGPRTVLADANGEWLYIYAMGDVALARVRLADLPLTGPYTFVLQPGLALGFTLLSGGERFGRHLFSNARFSGSSSSSCASCHVDGHTDGLSWDLSLYLEPEGTPAQQLNLGLDVKGPLVTQSMRRIGETGPYHWRGERGQLTDFNAAFASLLDHRVGGVPSDIGPDFGYVEHYLTRIALPPNPRQNLDRTLTPEQKAGETVFRTRAVFQGLSCSACHALPLGSSGEVVLENPGARVRTLDVPSLRGVGDKLSEPFTIGGDFGTRTRQGAGLGHAGALPDLRAVLGQALHGGGQALFALSATEIDQLEAYLLAFDTGLAPAAAFQVTAHTANAAAVQANELAFLLQQEAAGHCDLVALRTPRLRDWRFDPRALLWQPGSGTFQPAAAAAAGLTPAQLIAEARTGRPVTFLGLPRDMGHAYALDRDMDGAYDLDELAAGLNPERGNMDFDAFPDGHELRWGTNPLVANPNSPDNVAPQLVRPARLIYATTNTLKFEIEVSEPVQLQVSYNGQYPVNRLPLSAHKETRFSVVLGELEPDTDYALTLRLKDPANNLTYDTSATFRTAARTFADPVRIDSYAVQLLPGSQPGSDDWAVTVQLQQGGAPAPRGYCIDASVYHQAATGELTLVQANACVATTPSGSADFLVPLVGVAPSGAGALYFVVHAIEAPPGGAPHARAYDSSPFVSASY